MFAFIEGFYNPRRRHSSIGYLSPVDYEYWHQSAASIPTRDSRTDVRAGTKEWLRRGLN